MDIYLHTRNNSEDYCWRYDEKEAEKKWLDKYYELFDESAPCLYFKREQNKFILGIDGLPTNRHDLNNRQIRNRLMITWEAGNSEDNEKAKKLMDYCSNIFHDDIKNLKETELVKILNKYITEELLDDSNSLKESLINTVDKFCDEITVSEAKSKRSNFTSKSVGPLRNNEDARAGFWTEAKDCISPTGKNFLAVFATIAGCERLKIRNVTFAITKNPEVTKIMKLNNDLLDKLKNIHTPAEKKKIAYVGVVVLFMLVLLYIFSLHNENDNLKKKIVKLIKNILKQNYT